MKKTIIAVGLVAMFALSCSNTKETPSGYKYTVIRKGDGNAGKDSMVLIMNMSFKDAKDSLWADSKKQDYPTMVMKQDSLMRGDMVLEVFNSLSKGDSVTFQVRAKELFEKTFRAPLPVGTDSASLFTFNIGVVDLITQEQAQKMQEDIMAKLNEKEMEKQNKQLAIDTVLIDQYLKDNSLVAQKTASGLRYIITKQGKGDNAKPGQSVKINYAGFLLNGTCFDSSIESVAKANNVYNEARQPYAPLELVLGYRQVIPGWEEAIALMNKGSKMTVFIPSGLAYGPNKRSDVIVENSILKFDMELVDLK